MKSFYLDPFSQRLSNEEASRVFETFVTYDNEDSLIAGESLLKYEKQILDFFCELYLNGFNKFNIKISKLEKVSLYKNRLIKSEYNFFKTAYKRNKTKLIQQPDIILSLFSLKLGCREIIKPEFTFQGFSFTAHDEFVLEFTCESDDISKIIKDLAKKHNLYTREN